jgi:hypothetical protein
MLVVVKKLLFHHDHLVVLVVVVADSLSQSLSRILASTVRTLTR